MNGPVTKTIAVILLALAGLAVAAFARRDPISPARFDQIREGMPEAEAERLLGFPPQRSDPEYAIDREKKEPVETGRTRKTWTGKTRYVILVIDKAGLVAEKRLTDNGSRDFLDWAGRQAGL